MGQKPANIQKEEDTASVRPFSFLFEKGVAHTRHSLSNLFFYETASH